MAEIPVKALVVFYRQPDGVNRLKYEAGEVYTLPAHLAAHYSKLGKVQILEVAQDKPKRKRKKKKETENVTD